MEQGFFTILPSEIISNILSRLSVQTIAISKCVCKPWLHLLNTDYFVNSYLSKSTPALAVMMSVEDSNCCKVFELEEDLDLEFEDELDRDSESEDDLDIDSEFEDELDPLTKSDFPHGATIEASANGLLLLQTLSEDNFYICNPITREYCELELIPLGFGHGFGVSKISGQYKVVCIYPKCGLNSKSECHVYTLGTGSWRRIEASPYVYGCCSIGRFVNGNLHWMVLSESNRKKRWICCFDVETECFSIFSPPFKGRRSDSGDLYTLGDYLCFCDLPSAHKIVIWLLKDYEVDKSWTREFVITLDPDYSLEVVQPIKVFKNGDMLMLGDINTFIYYSEKTKTTQVIGLFGAWDEDYTISSMLLTPSLVSLKSLGMENVISF